MPIVQRSSRRRRSTREIRTIDGQNIEVRLVIECPQFSTRYEVRFQRRVLLMFLVDSYFVSWVTGGARRGLPPAGRVLTRLTNKDLSPFIERGIARYRAEHRDTDVFIFREILDAIVRCDRVLTTPGGSLLLAGRSGVGRRTAVGMVASMNNMKLFSPKVSRTYGLKQFKNDLKAVRNRRADRSLESVFRTL